MKTSKELRKILDAIHEYVDKNDRSIQMFFSIIRFDDESNILEDRIGVYGGKQTLLIALKDMIKQIKAEKEEFINW